MIYFVKSKKVLEVNGGYMDGKKYLIICLRHNYWNRYDNIVFWEKIIVAITLIYPK